MKENKLKKRCCLEYGKSVFGKRERIESGKWLFMGF